MLTLLRVRRVRAFGAGRSSTARPARFMSGLLAAFIFRVQGWGPFFSGAIRPHQQSTRHAIESGAPGVALLIRWTSNIMPTASYCIPTVLLILTAIVGEDRAAEGEHKGRSKWSRAKLIASTAARHRQK
jgi:hypothetical protein